MHGTNTRSLAYVAIGVLATLAILQVPLATVLPLLLIGGCLLMHVFMMRGMHHGGSDDGERSPHAHAVDHRER